MRKLCRYFEKIVSIWAKGTDCYISSGGMCVKCRELSSVISLTHPLG